MPVLNLDEYVRYLEEHKSVSDRTLKNYRDALNYVGIRQIDTENLSEVYKTLRAKLPKRYVTIEQFLAIMSAWAKKNYLTLSRDINYSMLVDEINGLKGERRAYADQELNLLFSAAKADGNNELLNLMLLLFYSGLRIGACHSIRYEDVRPVEGIDVYTYFVRSKGIRYQAIIAGHVWRNIEMRRFGNKELVVYYDQGFATPFEKLYESQFSRLIQRYGLYNVREQTSMFHSFRKSFAQHLVTSGVDPQGFFYKSLLGHMPRDTNATKFYVNPEGERVPLEMTKTLASVYAKSDLMTLTLGVS